MHLLEPLELRCLGTVERALGALAGLGVEQELDVGAHRLERAPQHHDVLVTVSGGRVTTRTAGRRSSELRRRRGRSPERQGDAACCCLRAICGLPLLQGDAVGGQAPVDDLLHELRVGPQALLALSERREPRVGLRGRPRLRGDRAQLTKKTTRARTTA